MSEKSDFVTRIYQAGLGAGLSDAAARVMAAQAGIESAYGKNAPGNNFFGITKGTDWNGKTVTRTDHDGSGKAVQREFRSYDTPEQGIADRIAMMDSKFPAFNKAATTQDALKALQTGKLGKYYEAPQKDYEAAVNGINTKYLPSTSANTSATRAIEAEAPAAKQSASQYLGALQYGKPGGGVGVNADKLHPEFANRLTSLIQAAEKATGDKVQVFEGYRDPARSAQLRANYKQENVTYDGKVYKPQPGVKGYQAAAPGVSEHNLGMAADIRAGKDPDKYPSGPAYDYMVKHAAEYGLHWMGSSDPAHFEVPPDQYQAAKKGQPLPQWKAPDGGPQPPLNIGHEAAPPLPRSRPDPATVLGGSSQAKALGGNIYDKMPADASYGVQQRLNPGQKAQLPADFQTLFAHGAPVDARTMSLAAPARSLGASGSVGNATTANGSATIVPGRSLGQPGAIKTTMAPAATVQMSASRPASVIPAPSQLQLLGQPANSSGSPDDRDAAQLVALKATKPSLTVPKATYTPPANNNIGAAPAPHQQGLFQSLGGAIGSGMTALGNSANDAAKYLGKGVQDTVAAIPEKAQQAADYLTPLVLGNLEARSAFLDPMIARLGSPTAGDHSPTRYGATFQDRHQAAQDRERLSQGLPPQQRQSQPQPQQRQQAPTISTTFRNTSPAPAPKSNSSPAPANNNGGGNSGGGNGGQQTITGSATGRSYTVGATYSNKDGNFVAQSNGTFKKVS